MSEQRPTSVHIAVRLDERRAELVERRLREVGLNPVRLAGSAEVAARLPEIEYLLIGRPPRIDWSPAGRLKLLHVAGAGVDPLFPARGLREQVVVTNSRGTMADAVRDHVLALMLALARDLPRAFAQQARRRWQGYSSASIAGKRVCVVGLGEIGGRVAQACSALGLSVVGVRRTSAVCPGVLRVYAAAELRQALTGADFVVLSLPRTSSSLGGIGEQELSVLGAGAFLVNVARGGIVDEQALLRALSSRRLAGAAMDVFADEPLPADSPLWNCPGLIITPHCAGFTPDYFDPVVALFIDAVQRLERGELPRNVVSREHEY